MFTCLLTTAIGLPPVDEQMHMKDNMALFTRTRAPSVGGTVEMQDYQ